MNWFCKRLLSQVLPTKRKKGFRDIKSFEDSILPQGFSSPPPQTQRAIAYSVAEHFDLSQLELQASPFLADDVVWSKLQEGDAFVFANGTVCTFGATEQEQSKILKSLEKCALNPYGFTETEYFDYIVDESQPGSMSSDDIILGNEIPLEQAKLVYAAAMTRSCKLASLENLLNDHLAKTKHIPSILLQGKKLPLTRQQVLQNLGELYSLRQHVNLSQELVDLPDFLWSSSVMERYFTTMSRNLDVSPRIQIFNKKLDYANEMAEMLRNHLHEQHSLHLEWAIIILISVEIGFEIVHYVERLFA